MRIFIFVFLMMSTVMAKGFRDSNWGDTQEQVRSSEKASFQNVFESGEMQNVLYSTKVYTYEMLLIYSFKNGKLVRGTYVPVMGMYTDGQKALMFMDIFGKYMDKYGEASDIMHEWPNPLYQQAMVTGINYLEAYTEGYLNTYITWFLENTEVIVECFRDDDDETFVRIRYESKL